MLLFSMQLVLLVLVLNIIVDAIAGAKQRVLETLARFSPASTFLITNILFSKVIFFLVLFTPLSKEDNLSF